MIDWQENRAAARYEAVRSGVYLGWWAEPEFRTCAARLKNLSQVGALVDLAVAPPEGASLWLCLAGSPPGDWVEVERVAGDGPRGGLVQLRLKFPESCPYELFEGAVLGHGGSS